MNDRVLGAPDTCRSPCLPLCSGGDREPRFPPRATEIEARLPPTSHALVLIQPPVQGPEGHPRPELPEGLKVEPGLFAGGQEDDDLGLGRSGRGMAA